MLRDDFAGANRYPLGCVVVDPQNRQMVPPRPGPEGTAGCYTFKLKDADVTCRKPASQEIRHPDEQLDSI
jgi:hypothetical protein